MYRGSRENRQRKEKKQHPATHSDRMPRAHILGIATGPRTRATGVLKPEYVGPCAKTACVKPVPDANMLGASLMKNVDLPDTHDNDL